MKPLLFTIGLLAGITIGLYLDYFRLSEWKAISRSNFNERCKWQLEAEALRKQLDSCENYGKLFIN